MAMTKKIYDGSVVTLSSAAATAVRDVVVLGTNGVGIALTSATAASQDISVEIVGVHEFPATTAEAFSVGGIAMWDTATSAALSTGTVTMGIILKGKAAGVAGTIEVKIG